MPYHNMKTSKILDGIQSHNIYKILYIALANANFYYFEFKNPPKTLHNFFPKQLSMRKV